MSGMRAVAIGIAVSGALVCSALVMAQQQRTTPPGLTRLQAVETNSESHQTGVTVVRLINTAEMNYKSTHGSYAAWNELFRSGAISGREKPGTLFQGLKLSAGPEVTPGWVLNLVTAAGGEGYELSLRNSPDACGFSFFSDQRGIIYQGGVIDCSVDLRPQS
ncbi:MAG: hypothetical protein WA185_08210 [Candidatus Acidiferrales bacterium]